LRAGGQLIAVSSQEQNEANKAKAAWGISYPMIGDPALVIAKELHRRGILTLYVDTDKWTKGDMKGLRTYKEGMIQPGICALTREWIKLYGWSLTPSAGNFGGATGRVHARDAWKAINRSLSGDFSLADYEPEYASKPKGGNGFLPRFFLKAMLLAEGNFIRPLGFELPPDGVSGRGKSHFNLKFLKNGTKWLVVLVAFALFASANPKRAVATALLYGAYFQVYCDPVYQHSWHLNSTASNNQLPSIAAKSRF